MIVVAVHYDGVGTDEVVTAPIVVPVSCANVIELRRCGHIFNRRDLAPVGINTVGLVARTSGGEQCQFHI